VSYQFDLFYFACKKIFFKKIEIFLIFLATFYPFLPKIDSDRQECILSIVNSLGGMMKVNKITPLSRVIAGISQPQEGQLAVRGPQVRGHQDVYVAENIRGSYSRLLNGTYGTDAERHLQAGREVAVKELGRKAKKVVS